MVRCREEGIAAKAAFDENFRTMSLIYGLALHGSVSVSKQERQNASGAASGNQVHTVQKRRKRLHNSVQNCAAQHPPHPSTVQCQHPKFSFSRLYGQHAGGRLRPKMCTGCDGWRARVLLQRARCARRRTGVCG
jgi:hypothetical protein